jgi:hypothetical protein
MWLKLANQLVGMSLAGSQDSKDGQKVRASLFNANPITSNIGTQIRFPNPRVDILWQDLESC